jgi:hypothetical protein
MAMAVPKDNAAALPTLDRFVEAATRDGLVAGAIARAGLRGVRPRRGTEARRAVPCRRLPQANVR